jgi:hypothetical protein
MQSKSSGHMSKGAPGKNEMGAVRRLALADDVVARANLPHSLGRELAEHRLVRGGKPGNAFKLGDECD